MQTETNQINQKPTASAGKNGIYKMYLKRPLDIVVSSVALVVLSPAIMLLAILVKIKLGSPVLFKQERPGLNEGIFTLYKFRTMTAETDEDGKLLPDHMRLTKFGLFLRSSSLDELPELWNILKGDMSLVGPRPLLIEYLPRYNNDQRRRHEVRPGLTGLAQVNGRNEISWDAKFALDVEYVETVKFFKDIKIMLLTVIKVIRSEGISSKSSVTSEKFKGNREEFLYD